MKKIIILVLLFIASIISFFFFKGVNNIDDYYEYINKKEIDKIDLKDKNEISTFTKAKDEVDKDVDKIVDELLKSNKNMSNFYNNLIDYDTRNKLGLTPIKSYIDKINNSNIISECLFCFNIAQVLNTGQKAARGRGAAFGNTLFASPRERRNKIVSNANSV